MYRFRAIFLLKNFLENRYKKTKIKLSLKIRTKKSNFAGDLENQNFIIECLSVTSVWKEFEFDRKIWNFWNLKNWNLSFWLSEPDPKKNTYAQDMIFWSVNDICWNQWWIEIKTFDSKIMIFLYEEKKIVFELESTFFFKIWFS